MEVVVSVITHQVVIMTDKASLWAAVDCSIKPLTYSVIAELLVH